MIMLDWLDDPQRGRGMRFAHDDSAAPWSYVPYTQLATEALGVADLLGHLGVRRGEVVSMVLADPHDFLCAFYGTLAAGGTASPLAPPSTFRSVETYTSHLCSLLITAEPAVVLVDPSLSRAVEVAVSRAGRKVAVLPFVRSELESGVVESRQPPAEHVLLQFTSGSSGTPKGVLVSADNLDVNTNAVANGLALRSDDVVVTWLPHFHDMGLVGSLLTPTSAGVNIRVFKPAHFIRSPLRWLQCLGRDGGTVTMSPSFGYTYAARRVKPSQTEDLDFRNWRIGVVGAERTDVVGVGRFVSLLRPRGLAPETLQVGYGLAEATLAVSATPPREAARIVRLGQSALRDGEAVQITACASLGDPVAREGHWIASCGTALPENEIRVVDDDGLSVPDGHHGQITVRGGSVAHAYRGALHAHTSTSFDGEVLNTGDTGFQLDGELYVVGRTGDSIKVRGVKLFAEDLDIAIGHASGLEPGRYVGLLGSPGGIDMVAAIVEADHLDWVPAVRSALSAMVSESTVIALFRGGAGCIERTSSGKPRRRVLWTRLLDGDLPVETVQATAALDARAL